MHNSTLIIVALFCLLVIVVLYTINLRYRLQYIQQNNTANDTLLSRLEKIAKESQMESSNHFVQQTQYTITPIINAIQSIRDLVQQSNTSSEKNYLFIAHNMKEVARLQEQVRSEAANLSNALSNPIIRGKWGEIQLRRIVELSGMIEHCDFDTQVSSDGSRPDMVINLPGNRQIILDAKVPFANYMQAVQNGEQTSIQKHKDNVKNHINLLSKKSYWKDFKYSPEFVIMFIPVESFLGMAIESDCAILEEAAEKNVIIATPMILLAMLKAICYSWRQESIAINIQEISKISIKIGEDIKAMTEQFELCENRITKAAEEYQKLRRMIDQKVFGDIQKLEKILMTVSK